MESDKKRLERLAREAAEASMEEEGAFGEYLWNKAEGLRLLALFTYEDGE